MVNGLCIYISQISTLMEKCFPSVGLPIWSTLPLESEAPAFLNEEILEIACQGEKIDRREHL